MIDSLPENTQQGLARAMAYRSVRNLSETPTTLVEYRSAGSLLVIGPQAQAREAVDRLHEQLNCTVITGPAQGADSPERGFPEGVEVIRREVASVQGYLGEFRVEVRTPDGPVNPALAGGRETFDLVLDLTDRPFIDAPVKPPGYYAPGGDGAAMETALAEIPTLVGEFEKPRYFRYDPDICAHGASGVTGCTLCRDACPTYAIEWAGEKIEVNPYLCQGVGVCATVCPSGAITYAYPPAADVLERVKRLLRGYRQHDGTQPLVLFHDREAGAEIVEAVAQRIPESVLPVEIEEAGSAGIEAWLAAIAYGASAVGVLLPPATPESVRTGVGTQVAYARAILDGMGLDGARIGALEGEGGLPAALEAMLGVPELPAATFAALGEKRTTLRLALEHLHRHAPSAPAVIPLPEGAPFGEVVVDAKACTLCMSCTSVCPAHALQAGGDVPRLSLIEWNCIQCGLCRAACPEDAITLAPRLLLDREARMRPRVLHEEPAFRCVACGKPFATASVIAKMEDKLKGHWMYQDEKAMRRLKMCDECRVKDMMTEGMDMPATHH